MNEHDRLVDRAARDARTVMFIGGLDSGKSTLARATAAFALRLGRSVAYLDADVSQKTVGPPATVGMKRIHGPDDLTLERMAHADALGFVGSTSPQDHLLPLVGALTRLSQRAHADGADLVVVDTSGMVSGIWGQLIKYYKVDMLEPDLVVGLQRGAGAGAHPGGVGTVLRGRRPGAPRAPERDAHQRRAAHGAARARDGPLLRTRAATVPREAHRLHADASAAVRPRSAGPSAGGALRRARRVHRGSATSST